MFSWFENVTSWLLWFCIASLQKPLGSLAPFSQPIRVKTNRVLPASVFPRFTQAQRDIWLIHSSRTRDYSGLNKIAAALTHLTIHPMVSLVHSRAVSVSPSCKALASTWTKKPRKRVRRLNFSTIYGIWQKNIKYMYIMSSTIAQCRRQNLYQSKES